jgi:hypothetical protein
MHIDLHMHTTASDGEHTPEAVIALAREARLDAIAITDHDTTDGYAPALAAAHGVPRVITGIELSAEDPVEGRENGEDVHMLGYGFDPEDAAFQAELRLFREDRRTRAERILEKLAALGVPVTFEAVLAFAGAAGTGKTASIGRPHIARAMVEARYVGTVREAFDRYLYTGGPAYVARRRLTPEDAIALIHRAGGAAVLAHPGLLKKPRAVAERLIAAGLDGIEVYHPDNWADVRLDMLGLVQAFDGVATGGSDFHGRAVSAKRLGQEDPPPDCVERLLARAARYRA